tara:strand:+ start:154 stop:573 length:420 start_codon:yes stop_codon:yes gene_type:complete
MPDYSKCVIYTIRTGEGLYVGSSCNFVKRKSGHKQSINNENSKKYNRKLYKTIRDNDGAWDMQPHSEYPCNSKTEMNIEEERVRQELKADLNMNSCYGLDIDKQKQTQKEYHKSYALKNKDKLAEYKKEYRLKKKQHNI